MRYKQIKESSNDSYYAYHKAAKKWAKDTGKPEKDFAYAGVNVQDEYIEPEMKKYGLVPDEYMGKGVTKYRRESLEPKESANPSLEALVKHIKEGVPLCDSIFRHHSESYLNTFKQAKQLKEQGVLPELDWESEEMLTLDIGESATLMNGETVWLDVPYMIEAQAPNISDDMIGVPDNYYDEEERKQAHKDYMEFIDRYPEDEYGSIADGFCPACGGNGYMDGEEEMYNDETDEYEEGLECDGTFSNGCDEGEIENASWVDIIKHDKRNAERQQAKDNYPGDEVVIKQVAAYMKNMDDPRQAYQQMAIDYPHMGRAERSGILAKAQKIAFPEVTEMKRLAGINESNPKREQAAKILHDLVEPDLDNFSSRDELESYMSDNMPEFYRGRDTGKAIEDAIELLSPNHKIPEAEYQGKKVELSKPKRGGSKKFYVYVKDPKTKNIKKVSFGADSGGGKLAVKLKDPKARKAFADRHNCDQKNDKTKAGYWSCRLPRYAKSLGLSGGGTWW